jgi:2-polyprenyl-3-methyl-5-hydroxy-6-metoxy-1,4-benzoquinol methylase
MKENIPLGNYFNKYTSNNLIVKFLMKGYKTTFQKYLRQIEPTSILEIGSGEGYIIRYIREIYPNTTLLASDIDFQFVNLSAKTNTIADWIVCIGEELPFPENTFNLIIACEVLEHVAHPETLLEEFQRVGNEWILMSVPNEPWWRLLNLARMKYVKNLGNTPGHIQHWSLKSFSKLIKKYIQIHDIRSVFPWTFALGKFK